MPRATRSRPLGILLLTLAAPLLSGCALALPQSTLHPAGDVARFQQGLFLFIFWIAVGVFVVVEGLLLFAMVRFRRRRGQERRLPSQVHGNTRLEIAWTIAPAIIVVAITIPTVRSIAPTYDPPPDQAGLAEAIDIHVEGHPWWWEYRYLDPTTKQVRFVTANEMHVPVGSVVRLTLTSADVIHSFSVPRLAGTRDAIPGRENRMWFRASEVGPFSGQCKELCGLSHANMRTIVVAEPQADYEAWVRLQQQPAAAPAGAAQRGAQVFQQGACIGCHTVRGTVAQATVGPDLTHFGSRTTIAAGILPKDPQGTNLAKWLHNPPAIKPGSIMPNLHLSEQEIADLAVYLESLK
ncbi:MAG: cytochrome c oxidase subunit II [Chloroflexi bacterium]|nr:cytochrome c oxidase subunit II [Chloroflexota bacterium]